MHDNDKPAKYIVVIFEYCWLSGSDEKRKYSVGWYEFHNRKNKTGSNKVHVHNIE